MLTWVQTSEALVGLDKWSFNFFITSHVKICYSYLVVKHSIMPTFYPKFNLEAMQERSTNEVFKFDSLELILV